MEGLAIGSANARIGLPEAIAVLKAGGTAVDAVVAAIKPVEANPLDHSVGYAGLPNLSGEVELDASLMDGRTLATGAVGALTGYQDAIELARKVMEVLPHVLIVGDGARRFAEELGFVSSDLLTPESKQVWQSRMDELRRGAPDAYMDRMRTIVGEMSRDPEHADAHGTVNVIVRDGQGNVACGVSTSGWAWKYPGRLGDSPIVGAGNYADNRWGAAACTGRGEMAQRCCTAHSVVTALRYGVDLTAAVHQAMTDLVTLDDPFASEINIVAVDRHGNRIGASSTPGKTYVTMTESMSEVAEIDCLVFPFPP